MSSAKPRTKQELAAIHKASEAVDAALKALQAAAHLGPSNPPAIEAAMKLVRGAAAHSDQWKLISEG